MAKRMTQPYADNPSGEWCKACRETGLSHCGYPDECGQMVPMTPRPPGMSMAQAAAHNRRLSTSTRSPE